MKILHAFFTFKIGGSQTMLVDIINEQILSNDVSLMVVNNCIDDSLLAEIDSRVKIILCRRPEGSKNPYHVLLANLRLWSLNPDIIHIHEDKLANFLFLRRGAKLVFTKHNAVKSPISASRIDYFFGISKAASAALGNLESTVIYNGIHVDDVEKKDIQWSSGKSLNFVEVGRIEKNKGQQTVIEAFRILKEKGITDVSMTFIGDGSNASYIKGKAEEYGVSKMITFLGMKDRDYIYSHLKYYDAYIQPSISEGFGLTIAEAVAAKLPVISSDQEGSIEVLNEGRYGIMFKTGDPSDLAEKIILFREGNVKINIEEAYAFVRSNFDIRNTANNYLAEYSKVLLS